VTTAPTERVGYAHTPTLRNANQEDLLALLNEQQAWKVDLVVPAEKLQFSDGELIISGQEPVPDADGVTDPNGVYRPTQAFDGHLAERLGIPVSFLRRLRLGRFVEGKQVSEPRLDLFDDNVNGLLQGRDELVIDGEVVRSSVPHDQRKFLARLLQPGDGQGIATGLMSDKYAEIDNYDVVLAVLDGIRSTGIDDSTLRITGDISETRMYLNIQAPELLTLAADLFDGYRSPFDPGVGAAQRIGQGITLEQRIELGRQWRKGELRQSLGAHHMFVPGQEPLCYAGAQVRNSENGFSLYSITPMLVGLGCTNGMLIHKDAYTERHSGSAKGEGWIRWSEKTLTAKRTVIAQETADMLRQVFSREYMDKAVSRLSEKATKPIAEPDRVIEVVAKKVKWSEAEQKGILQHFMRGNKWTTGGVMHAVTSFSQTVRDADAAHELDKNAVAAMEFAYAAV
jgi:hypothetical protein